MSDGVRAGSRRATAGAGLVLPAALAASWELLAALGVLPPYLVRPSLIVAALMAELTGGELLRHAAITLGRVAASVAIGIALGATLGLVAGSQRRVAEFFDPLVALAYPIPKVIFLPLFLVWFGLGDTTIVVTTALAAFFPLFISGHHAARSVSRSLLWAGRSMGTTGWRAFTRIVVPASLPELFAGIRIANATAFVVVFVAEVVSPRAGMGYLILFSSDFNRYDTMFAAIVTLALLGFATDRAWLRARRWLVPYAAHRAA